jgi:PAN domain-containing protein
MGPSGYFRLAASATMVLALSAALQAQGNEGGDGEEHWMRRSTWELSTSLTFNRYIEPFERAASARACRDRCVQNRRCTGWTFYDANFSGAGEFSYRLQRVCVLGSGVKDRKFGGMPGRTSGVVNGEGAQD